MPAGKILGSLDLDPICLFLDAHYLLAGFFLTNAPGLYNTVFTLHTFGPITRIFDPGEVPSTGTYSPKLRLSSLPQIQGGFRRAIVRNDEYL
jgi:hypothetical protein